MYYIIREMKEEEYPILRDFLYEAIYIPEGIEPPPKSVLDLPELQEYIFGFGEKKDDFAMAAEVHGEIVGAVWVRIMHDYGHMDENTPSLAMSLYKAYRSQGIGTALLKELLLTLKSRGYRRVSLSVQKDNYAEKLYKKLGFSVISETMEEYIMAISLEETFL